MLGGYRRAVVVVAHVGRYNERVILQRQGTGYVRERIVRQPSQTIIVGLTRMHLVAKVGGTGRLATRRRPRRLVVPGGEERACVTDREVRLPLRLGGVGVGVQLEWRAEGHAAVGGTNVEDVAGVTADFSGIVVVNDVVVSSNLTPAHVPPVSRVGVHRAKVTRN